MAVRAEVRPELITWARERSRIAFDDLSRRFPKLEHWELGDTSPTLKQLESFASATHTPLGFLFLHEPPEERIPISDFRTIRNETVQQPSPNLLDTIFQSQQRQEWYRDYAIANHGDRVRVVGSLTTAVNVTNAAESIREELDFELTERDATWTDTFRRLAEKAEELGILVMVNGVVGSNTHRKLDPHEFRGFALVDEYAPTIFVNGADTKAAQIFTLTHELVHIWLGQSALTDVDIGSVPDNEIERWCDEVAAEILAPMDAIHNEYRPNQQLTGELDRLARKFKVSTLVILRRVHDAGYLGWEVYRNAYRAELNRALTNLQKHKDSGGNFYNTQPVRTSKLFTRAIIASTLEGQTLYRDAFQMLGLKKISTFNELAHRLEVA